MTVAIEGARLVLRPFIESDVDARASYQALPEVARYLYRPPLDRRATQRSTLANPERKFEDSGDSLLFAVVRRADQVLLGEVVATLTSAAARQVEVGWVFAPTHTGHGYATEAARALIGWLFSEHATHRVFARLDADNESSVRLCERLGMRREAHFVENDLDGHRWGSEYVYAVLHREFETHA